MAARKLQTEIEKTLKKVAEGVSNPNLLLHLPLFAFIWLMTLVRSTCTDESHHWIDIDD